MKLRVALLAAICLTLVAVPAFAGTVYDDGPINGTVDAWTINFGFIISDTFTVSTANANITGLSFGAWLEPGDTLETAEVSLTSMPENSGTSYFDQVVSFSQSGCNVNQYGFDVCTETSDFHGPTLPSGTYWLNLQNAVTVDGDPVYWDENSGVGCTSPGCPSLAQGNNCLTKKAGNIGCLPPESFTLYGNTSSGTVPEPSSILLLGSGVLAAVGIVRHRMR